ncbi:MAG: hypothetical protein NTW48_08975 [Chloroflexi bacterium]|nr:hypothetical protein [Chloroflexota bacterium]
MKLLKSLQAFLKSCCVISKEPQLIKLNHDMDKIEQHVNQKRAVLNGEDTWFLAMEKKPKGDKSL